MAEALATASNTLRHRDFPGCIDGKVILQRDGNSTESELLALDARTGNVVWRTARPL